MSKKDELIKEFKKVTGEVLTKDFPADSLAKILNTDPKLRTLFREAVEEAESPEASVAAGMGVLFPDNK